MKTTILIDSRDREPNSASTSDFVVKLGTPLQNVVRVDLRQLIVSEGIYNVSDTNGLFLLNASYQPPSAPSQLNTIAVSAGYIPVGYYTLSQFATALETAMTSVLDANAWGSLGVPYLSCSVNASRTLEVWGANAYVHFALSFPTQECATLFGFLSTNGRTSDVSQDIDGNLYSSMTADTALGLETIEYLLLRSPELGNRLTTARGVPAYDVIPIPDRIRPLVYTRYEAGVSSEIAKRSLFELHLSLTKPTGAVLDLRGNDLAIVLDVETSECLNR
jgi:hypothetical protein